MATDHERLNDILKNAGVSKTVYALVMPETEQTIDEILGNADSPERETFRDMYRAAWTQKQDAMHEAFFATWKEWNKPIVQADWSHFPYMYPTMGASEGLREAIYAYGAQARAANKEPVIHIFTGEYEGFAAYAAAAGIKVKTHNRKNWQEALDEIGPGEQFYISQPSAIDGNVWGDFESFARSLNEIQPTAQLMLDLTYVGCVADPFQVKADHPNIPAIFFSLSKPMGAYYHRIGGCLSRTEYPGLFGNKWFKNLLSLKLGTRMMEKYDVFELPKKYKPIQQSVLQQTNTALGLNLESSDVILLGTANPGENPSDIERYLTRGSEGEELVRVCLTPNIAKTINPDIDNTVKARPHEGLENNLK